MSAEVDQGSAVEPHKIEMSAKTTSSGASLTSGPRASIFAAKSGFVIPKNKLSGSLIPIFRGVKKSGGNDAANDDSPSQVRRKSKWGPDPTQDAAVRKGRALAYQTRIDQITQQLISGVLESEETQSSEIAELPADSNLSAPQMDFKVSEMLKLEKREIIGEILKLNPSFKTPPDYVPLLKEATVSIPVKDYPGYNFVGLIFGPGSETQKRLEKETKAKVQVFGTKADTGEKVEISASNMNETHAAYKELSVHVSADTFEKVDGAVALIELLVTSVSENLTAGNNQNAANQSHPSGEQGIVQPAHTPQQGQFQFQGTFGDPSQASGKHLSLGFNLAQNSPPIHNNNSLPSHPNPSFYGSQPISSAGFTSALPGTSFVQPQMQTQVPSYPYPPRNFHIPAPQPPLPIIPSQPQLLRPSMPLPGSGVPFGPRPLPPQLVNAVPFSPGSSTINVPMNHPVPAHQPGSSMNGISNAPPLMTAASQQPTGVRGLFPGNAVNPTILTTSKPPHSGLGDFTFRAHQPMQNPPPNPRAMQTPSFRLGVPDPMHLFPRQPVAHRPFAGTTVPSRGPGFPNSSPLLPPIRSFNAGPPQRPDLAGPLHPLPRIAPSANMFAPNQQPSTNRLFASNLGPGGGQIYDPFSPT